MNPMSTCVSVDPSTIANNKDYLRLKNLMEFQIDKKLQYLNELKTVLSDIKHMNCEDEDSGTLPFNHIDSS